MIFHKDGSSRYNIVDGQQRLTTLSILLYCLGNRNHCLFAERYGELSTDAIVRDFRMLTNRVNELLQIEKNKYKDYLLNQSTTVQNITDNEKEAFQFFDSQNFRGKELEPHDLLKSYNLREMSNVAENKKVKIINS